MKYLLISNIIFEAGDVKDACLKLARHFENMAHDKPDDLIESGAVQLLMHDNCDPPALPNTEAMIEKHKPHLTIIEGGANDKP